MPRRRAAKASREASNNAEAAGLDVNEKILFDVNKLYTGKDGVENMAKDLGLDFLHPRKKTTVMIIGNHSAGKSSFINWYCDEHVQNTSVAVETRGFTIVTRGKKRELAPIKGPGVLHMYPHLAGLEENFGPAIMENLTTCVSVSDAKMFPLVDFIDTPGLVDGNVEYPFDVNEVIGYLADFADLILVFLDPIGQALGSRIVEVVGSLNEQHYDKMRYYVTKADTVADPADLTKVVVQITQALVPHVHNTHGFDIPTIFIPLEGDTDALQNKMNSLGKLCGDIQRSVHQKIQDNLNILKDHVTDMQERGKTMLAEEARLSRARASRQRYALLFGALAWMLPLLLLLFAVTAFHESMPASVATQPWFQQMLAFLQPTMEQLTKYTPELFMDRLKVAGALAGAFFFFLLLSKFFSYRASRFVILSSSKLRRIRSIGKQCPALLQQQKALYKKYFAETVAPEFKQE